MKFNALWTKRTALGLAGLAMIWTATTAQAQLIIDVYPSIDNPTTQTIWIFGGSSSAHYTSTIRSSGNYHARDSWKLPTVFFSTDFYTANKPTNQLVSLSPLFSSTNNPRDIESVKVRQASAVLGTGAMVDLARERAIFSSSTNTPTVTTGSGSKNIGSIFMNDAADDEIGIRHTGGSNLWYTNQQRTYFSGSGIIDKPVSDFFVASFPSTIGDPYFSGRG